MEVMTYRTSSKVTKFTPLNELSEAFLSYREYIHNDPDRVKKLEHAAKLVISATENELTDRQRECVHLYYFERMKQKEIAKLLSLNQSTVSRCLKVARKRLEKCLKYVFC